MLWPNKIDAHSHLSFLQSEQIDKLLDNSETLFIQGGYDLEDFKAQLTIKNQYPDQIQISGGLHPWIFKEKSAEQIEHEWVELKSLISQNRCFIGETGFDKSVPASKDVQYSYFCEHLELAKNLDRPLVCHINGHHDLALKALKDLAGPWRGIIHGFSGSLELAKGYIKMGFFISVGPGVLKPNYKNLVKSLQDIEVENIVIESDQPTEPGSPYLSGMLDQVSGKIAEIKGISSEEVLQNSNKNLERLLL